MNRSIAMLIIGLVFGGGLGFLLAAANGVTLDGHDHATDHGTTAVADAHQGHGEDLLESDPGHAPSIRIAAFPDPISGWNLNIVTTNFTFAPENAGLDHVEGEGHAHLYANGVKLGRVYGDWVHLSDLPEGPVELEVTLNGNDHRGLAVGGKPIAAQLTLEASGG